MKKYIVTLTQEERDILKDILKKGKSPAYKIKHANILLNADLNGPNKEDKEIASMLHCHYNTVGNVRQRYVENSLEEALERKKQNEPPRKKILDGEKEAKLIAIACSQPPDGRVKWTLELMAEKMIELKIVESISAKTVERTLKKTSSNRILRNVGLSRPKKM